MIFALLNVRLRSLGVYHFKESVRGGRIFYDGCYLRYNDYYFFNESFECARQDVCVEPKSLLGMVLFLALMLISW